MIISQISPIDFRKHTHTPPKQKKSQEGRYYSWMTMPGLKYQQS